MPAIAAGSFNNRDCTRIIKASYAEAARTNTANPNDRREFSNPSWPGNKALIYGAAAAGFVDLVSYVHGAIPCVRPIANPPLRQDVHACCMGNNDQGHCFHISDLVDSINVHDPKPLVSSTGHQWHIEMDNFMKHYGKIWYFCKRR